MSFDVTDSGDFVDGVYSTRAASVVYSLLIGRKTPQAPAERASERVSEGVSAGVRSSSSRRGKRGSKHEFTEADILYKGYLHKEGSWVKSWKHRYFVLRSDIRELCYYSSKEDMTLIGSIRVDQNTCVWTNKAGKAPEFVLSWTPPKGSREEKREVKLRASDVVTKTVWMEHIAAEASRTTELALKDWWQDLFGNVMYQRKGHEIEARKKVASVINGMKKFSILPGSDIHGKVRGKDESSPEESSASPVGDDLDARAEQLALNVLNKMRERRSKAAVTSMSGLFADVDENIDDEVNSDISEGEVIGEAIDDAHMAREHKKTIVEKIADDHDEDDIDEDFLFSRSMTVVDDQSTTHASTLPNKDSDDDTDDEDEKDVVPPPGSTPKLMSETNTVISSSPAHTKIKNPGKASKEKKIGPPPLADTHADRFEVNGGSLSGLCICVELGNVLVGNEKIWCSLSAANLSEGAEWNRICHTESYKLENSLSSGSAQRVVHQFNLLQDPAFLRESTHILVILYQTTGKAAKGAQKGDNDTPICSGIIRCDELLSTGGITQVKMKISDGSTTEVAKPNISEQEASYNAMCVHDEDDDDSTCASVLTQSANLGVVLLSSSVLCKRRMKLTSDMKCRPYAENMYCFRTVSGENLVLEQIFASRYSLTVAKAMLGLIIPERMALLSSTKKIVKNDMKKAISVLKNIPSKAALQELDNMLTGGGELDGKNTIGTVSRAQSFQKTKNCIKQIRDVMLENYNDCDFHCTQALEGETFPGMVISPDVGGSQLRRSVWKKSPVWQFCTTNLNVNAISWRVFSDGELKSQAHIDASVKQDSAGPSSHSTPQAKLSTAASVTFGAPAAHSFGFGEGGLRKLMSGLGTNEQTRIKWMCILQSSGGVSMDLLKKSYGDNAKEFRNLFDVHIDMSTGDGWTSVFQKASKLAMRIDACASQALGFAIVCIKTVLTLATYGESHQLNCLANAFALNDFLIPVESFLSTQGHEMGMIEDLEAAVLWLSSVKVRLVSSYNQNRPTGKGVYIGLCDDLSIRRDPNTGCLVVDLEMNHEEITTIKKILAMNAQSPTGFGAVAVDDIAVRMESTDSMLGKSEGVILKDTVGTESEADKKKPSLSKELEILTEFKLTGVVFSCGVNEMQSLVNLKGGKEAHKQNEINLEGFERLNRYIQPMLPSPPAKNSTIKHANPLVDKIRSLSDELKTTLETSRANPHVKTPGVLIRSAKICRAISGTVGILCKSGKDRTSMGVTLEQSCVLSDKADYVLDGQESTRVMRKYGVRRMNVYANTGQGYYAFNSFQQQMLPKCYRPPGGTYGGNVAS